MRKISELKPPLKPQQVKELLSQFKKNEGDLPIKKTDVFSRLMYFSGTGYVTGHVPRHAKDVAVPSVTGPLEKFEFVPGYITTVPFDEDAPSAQDGAEENTSSMSAERIIAGLCKIPLVDDFRQWQDAAAAEKAISDHLIDLQPEALALWTDVTSDTTITNLAFQGLAAHLLIPVVGQEPAAFAVDLAWMGELPVRDGNERMGATALFDADKNLLSIYVSNDDATYVPGDELWEHAKWHWRCAVFAFVTVADHLSGLHLCISEVMMQATREQLPADHPLRRLLKPHVFGVGEVNSRATSMLAAEGGVAHRLWPFTFDGLTDLLVRGIEMASYEPFPVWLNDRGLDGLSDEFYPYATDGLALHSICREYAEGYVEIYFPGESIVNDAAVQAWWKQLETTAPRAGLKPLQTKEQVVDLLGQFIFAVSGYHSQVGALASYLVDQSFMGAKVRVGSEFNDIQSTVLQLTLNGMTGVYEPKLLDDYTHMFLELNKEQAVEVFQRFQDSLIALGLDIDARNETRSMPMRTFHPAVLDCSVSK